MKTVIIENQWKIEDEMQRLLNQEPELFQGYTTHLNALYAKTETGQLIATHDALLIQSTFYYSSQLERLMTAFYDRSYGPDRVHKVYAHNILHMLDEWTEPGRVDHTFIMNGKPAPAEKYAHSAHRSFSTEKAHARFLRELVSCLSRGIVELYDWSDDFKKYDSRTWQPATQDTPEEYRKYWHDESKEYHIRRVHYDKKLNRFHFEGLAPYPYEWELKGEFEILPYAQRNQNKK